MQQIVNLKRLLESLVPPSLPFNNHCISTVYDNPLATHLMNSLHSCHLVPPPSLYSTTISSLRQSDYSTFYCHPVLTWIIQTLDVISLHSYFTKLHQKLIYERLFVCFFATIISSTFFCYTALYLTVHCCNRFPIKHSSNVIVYTVLGTYYYGYIMHLFPCTWLT